MAAAAFAITPAFAGDKDKDACCAKDAKMTTESFAKMNLSAEQKTKMDALMAEHHKEGCSAASEAKYTEGAKGILTKEQFAKFKAECKAEKPATQS